MLTAYRLRLTAAPNRRLISAESYLGRPCCIVRSFLGPVDLPTSKCPRTLSADPAFIYERDRMGADNRC